MTASEAHRSGGSAIVARLSLMMFLQYAVWGAWLPLAAVYLGSLVSEGGLGFSGYQIGLILGLGGSIGAVLSPFIAGQIADRYFRTEHCLAALLMLGGVVQWVLQMQTSYGAWLALSIVYSIVYMPTLALSNSMAFAHLRDGSKQFPIVRVWGTIGWIAAGWLFSVLWLPVDLTWLPPFVEDSAGAGNTTPLLVNSLKFSAILSFLYGAYCLSLPATPPKKDAVESLAFSKAFGLLRHRSFLVLVLASLPISVIHNIYFLKAGPFLTSASVGLENSQVGPAMTVGQLSEIPIMAALGFVLTRMGFRSILFVGGLAYMLRYLVWGMVSLPPSLLIASQALHGVCYACFFATAYIYVDKIAPRDIRHSAQTVFGILILGAGPVIGGYLSGFLQELYTPEGGELDFKKLWWTLSAMSAVTAAFIWMAFRDETAQIAESESVS